MHLFYPNVFTDRISNRDTMKLFVLTSVSEYETNSFMMADRLVLIFTHICHHEALITVLSAVSD